MIFAYAYGTAASSASLDSVSLDRLVALLTLTSTWRGTANVETHDAEWRKVGRRGLYREAKARQVLQGWSAGTVAEVGLLTGHPDEPFAQSNVVSVRRAAGESPGARVLGMDLFVHCRLSLPEDSAPLLSQLVPHLWGSLCCAYGIVHLTARMLCASSELDAASNATCITLPGEVSDEHRQRIALERDIILSRSHRFLGSKLLDIYWANYLTGDLRDRVRTRLEREPGSCDCWELTDIGDATLLRVASRPMTAEDPEFVSLRSRMRRTLADECILAPWSGFV